MKKQFFAYSKTRKNGKYMEITEETYHELRATGEHYFICLDGAFLECEEQEYRAYFKEKNRAENIQRDKHGCKVVPLSYDSLSHSSNFENKGTTAQRAAIALARHLLAAFPSYFTKILANTYSISSVFCFI